MTSFVKTLDMGGLTLVVDTLKLGATKPGQVRSSSLISLSSSGITGQRSIVSGSGATVTLTAAQSGSLVLLDRAAGIVFTLPANDPGLWFEFHATTSVTSNAYKISTATQGTEFFTGGYVNVDTDTSNAVAVFTGDGTTHDNISMNGTTTGGLIGTRLKVSCLTSGLWMVEGQVNGNGAVATAFATS